jgi:hypothetical protein
MTPFSVTTQFLIVSAHNPFLSNVSPAYFKVEYAVYVNR